MENKRLSTEQLFELVLACACIIYVLAQFGLLEDFLKVIEEEQMLNDLVK